MYTNTSTKVDFFVFYYESLNFIGVIVTAFPISQSTGTTAKTHNVICTPFAAALICILLNSLIQSVEACPHSCQRTHLENIQFICGKICGPPFPPPPSPPPSILDCLVNGADDCLNECGNGADVLDWACLALCTPIKSIFNIVFGD